MDSQKKNLLVRIASAAVLLPVVVVLLWLGGTPFTILVAAASALVAREIYGIAGIDPIHPAALAGMAGAIVLVIAGEDVTARWPAIVCVLAFAPVAIFALSTLVPPGGDLRRAAQSAAWITASVPYAGLLASVVALRAHPDGLVWTMLALAMTWGNDTGAYFVGIRFGRRKLYPKVSPHKSWEGFFGGLGASVLAAAIFRLFLPLDWADVLVLGGVAGVLGPLGDLSESMIKRAFDVKDSGQLIPGHGGIFDRLDALLFVAPWTLAYQAFFIS
ncbi:MAG: phosphatidate cytidylyltransferase [Pseudomonadota bacterium]|nr:MAG: phosphatidate cytidylyltransferase [Pseudomonadota bacterium]